MNRQAQRFTGEEVEFIDAALGDVPGRHIHTAGIREFVRDSYMMRKGNSYPTIMASYNAHSGSAFIYEGAFRGVPGVPVPPDKLTGFAVQCCIGAGLATDEKTLDDWCRVIGRQECTSGRFVLFEKSQIQAAMRFGDGLLEIDFTDLPAEVGLAIAYAAFVNFGDELRRGEPAVYQHMFSRFFPGSRTSARRPTPVVRRISV